MSKERVETKLLGVGWNKKDDTFAVELEINEAPIVSKRTMLKTLFTRACLSQQVLTNETCWP